MPTVDDLINFAIGQQPTKFASAFDDIMGEKTAAAIDAMRTSVAQGIYAEEEDTSPDEDDIGEDEFDDVDEDEIDEDEFDDVDDLDLDDDDFDLEDSDLEGLDDGEDA